MVRRDVGAFYVQRQVEGGGEVGVARVGAGQRLDGVQLEVGGSSGTLTIS